MKLLLIIGLIFFEGLITFTGSISGAQIRDEYTEITEQRFDFQNIILKTVDDRDFNLREYSKDKVLVIVNFSAAWCDNSNRNGHVLKRLHDRFQDKGLGVVVVMEYSTQHEMRIHINRIGINYPIVVDTIDRNKRKKSIHYRYRRLAGDKREWGTPFYVIFMTDEIADDPGGGVLVRRVWVVSGELIEDKTSSFIEEMLKNKKAPPNGGA